MDTVFSAILVDDEDLSRESLEYALKRVAPNAEIYSTSNVKEALKFVKTNGVDVAMLDINMPEMDGLTLAKEMKDARPEVNIIFVTAYSEYAVDAFKQHESGYLLKPAKPEDIERELQRLEMVDRTPAAKNEQTKGFYIQCFGRFEIFQDGKPIVFGRSAEKEILAYLVSLHGAGCNTNEICGALWEDSVTQKKRKDYFRVLINSLKKNLEDLGLNDFLIKQRNYFAIDPDKVKCDYFDFLNGDIDAVNAYHGQFMTQYTWSEYSGLNKPKD